jgi:hypothetical protein
MFHLLFATQHFIDNIYQQRQLLNSTLKVQHEQPACCSHAKRSGQHDCRSSTGGISVNRCSVDISSGPGTVDANSVSIGQRRGGEPKQCQQVLQLAASG